MEHAAVSTLTFGRAQHICVAEATHKGHTAEGVQPDGPRAEILHGDIPHLKGQGGEPSEGIQPRVDQDLQLGYPLCLPQTQPSERRQPFLGLHYCPPLAKWQLGGRDHLEDVCVSEQMVTHPFQTPDTFPRAGPGTQASMPTPTPLPGLQGTEAVGKVGGRQ